MPALLLSPMPVIAFRNPYRLEGISGIRRWFLFPPACEYAMPRKRLCAGLCARYDAIQLIQAPAAA